MRLAHGSIQNMRFRSRQANIGRGNGWGKELPTVSYLIVLQHCFLLSLGKDNLRWREIDPEVSRGGTELRATLELNELLLIEK